MLCGRAGIVAHRSIHNLGKRRGDPRGDRAGVGDVVLIQDGDLEYDPNDYARLLEPIVQGTADVVYGSRFLGKPVGMEMKNRIANRILTAAANVLYGAGLTDEATAYKAFRIAILREMQLECRRFEFCPEVTAKLRRLGYQIREVPISYNARGIADGKKIRAREDLKRCGRCCGIVLRRCACWSGARWPEHYETRNASHRAGDGGSDRRPTDAHDSRSRAAGDCANSGFFQG